MHRQPVVLIAFEEQDNLGVGYVASVLLQDGFTVKILDFRLGVEAIVAALAPLDPLAVGFSLIFQFHIDSFRELMTALRRAGVTCHFTAGGHYPSLRPAELLDFIPELDSIVLFDGELTCRALMTALATGEEWCDIPGLAYRDGEQTLITPLRPLERELDKFPPPVRQPLREYAFGKKYATLLAGRGCINHCAFCSIREFYTKSGGPIKRVRRPEMVVREMQLLHEQLGCSIFMFQDDDFPVTYRGAASGWGNTAACSTRRG
jgi:anaerobic magnesium-protoporphyrin IX monomethyl ester cyclase